MAGLEVGKFPLDLGIFSTFWININAPPVHAVFQVCTRPLVKGLWGSWGGGLVVHISVQLAPGPQANYSTGPLPRPTTVMSTYLYP